MDYFFTQYQYNVNILLKNISREFNIDIKLLNSFYPIKLSTKLEIIVKNHINKNRILNENTNSINNYFMDTKGENYYEIINKGPIIVGKEYDAILVTSPDNIK